MLHEVCTPLFCFNIIFHFQNFGQPLLIFSLEKLKYYNIFITCISIKRIRIKKKKKSCSPHVRPPLFGSAINTQLNITTGHKITNSTCAGT